MAFCITYLENLTFLLLLTGVIVYLYSRVFRTQRKAQPAASQKPFSDGTNWQRPPKITQLKGTAYNFKIGPKENHEILSPWPDYAALTGVPWPKPYDGFILHKALPRPYRPFRWPYHQTMCR